MVAGSSLGLWHAVLGSWSDGPVLSWSLAVRAASVWPSPSSSSDVFVSGGVGGESGPSTGSVPSVARPALTSASAVATPPPGLSPFESSVIDALQALVVAGTLVVLALGALVGGAWRHG